VAISATAEPVARRLMRLVGGGDDPRLQSFDGRVEHRDVVDELVSAWVGQRTLEEVVAEAEAAEAAVAPVYQQRDVAADPHVRARGVISEVGGVPMQGLVARLSATPGRVPFPARPLGADTDAVLAELDQRDERASRRRGGDGDPPSA
jgi:crotonobetainyl-CoA:carnitine CoA-transferase CaiB-like acyl-CoA transferase